MRWRLGPVSGWMVLILSLGVVGCTTTYREFEEPSGPQEFSDDRPIVAFNTLMRHTLPAAQRELERGPGQFSPMAYALSRQGGVRPVHISPGSRADDEARVAMLFESLDILTRGDEIVAFVIYAAGSGRLVDTRHEDQVLIAHLEHASGHGLLRRLSYTRDGGRVRFGAEDIGAAENQIFTASPGEDSVEEEVKSVDNLQ